MHNFQKLKNISLKAVNFFSNKNKSNLFEWNCLFSSSYSGVTAIFTAMLVILSERPITYFYDFAINMCTHRLEIIRKVIEDQNISYFLTWISYMFDVLKFDLGVNYLRYNLNKLLSMASLWNHFWKDTIVTSSSDIYCNLYWLCPWLFTPRLFFRNKPKIKHEERQFLVLASHIVQRVNGEAGGGGGKISA